MSVSAAQEAWLETNFTGIATNDAAIVADINAGVRVWRWEGVSMETAGVHPTVHAPAAGNYILPLHVGVYGRAQTGGGSLSVQCTISTGSGGDITAFAASGGGFVTKQIDWTAVSAHTLPGTVDGLVLTVNTPSGTGTNLADVIVVGIEISAAGPGS